MKGAPPPPRHTLVALRGEIAFDTAPLVRRQLLETARHSSLDLVVELSRTSFLDDVRPDVEEPERRPGSRQPHRKRAEARETMTGDRDREILAETERQLRREDPRLARRFEGTRRLLQRRFALVATSIPVMILLLLLFVVSVVLGLGLITLALAAFSTASIWFRVRREGGA
jgi:hypothetical protein